MLNQNPNGLLLFRDELSGFLHTMDRRGHENDLAFYCEAWNGKGAYTYDRIGRGTLHIRAPCLSVLGGIQPGPLERYLRAVFAGRGDDGLLQRFQMAVWPDGGGPWRNVDRWPNADAWARVNEVFRRLTTLEPAGLGAEELTPEELPFLRFDAEAQERFDAWRGDVEQTLRAEADHPVWLSHVAKYRSLMPRPGSRRSRSIRRAPIRATCHSLTLIAPRSSASTQGPARRRARKPRWGCRREGAGLRPRRRGELR